MKTNDDFNNQSADPQFFRLDSTFLTTKSDTDTNDDDFNSLIAPLKVKNLDPDLLTTESKELSIVNQYFESITSNDKSIEQLLWECLGYALSKSARLSKAFIFKGNGRNGKSKLFRILEHLLPEEYCSHEHLENLCGTKPGGKTTVKHLENTTCCILEDQKQVKYINMSLITRIISGETIAVGEDEIKPYCTLLFSVNDVIDFKETGLHITDRILVIPFKNTFLDSTNNRDINIENKLCQEKSLRIIATKALDAFKKVLDRGYFSIPQIVIDETNKYFLECNNVAEFCGLYPIETFITKSRYYQEYKNWCNYNNREAVNNSKFGKEVLALGYRAERYSFKNDRKTYYSAPNFQNCDTQTVYDKYLKKSGITRETASHYTEDELLKTFEGITTFDKYLCDELYKNESKNEESS